MRTFVISDIHGQLDKLKEVLQKTGFDMQNDSLICLGDFCDRGPDSKGVIDLLACIKNIKVILGNHDLWLVEWLMYQHTPSIWLEQGGKETINSFNGLKSFNKYLKFYSQARVCYIDDENRFFAHASYPIKLDDDLTEFIWDRSIARGIISDRFIDCPYSEVFLGHTVVGNKPINKGKFWLMDTGAGFGGRITMMNIKTKKITQSSGLLHD